MISCLPSTALFSSKQTPTINPNLAGIETQAKSLPVSIPNYRTYEHLSLGIYIGIYTYFLEGISFIEDVNGNLNHLWKTESSSVPDHVISAIDH
jgi:hypothetical protein